MSAQAIGLGLTVENITPSPNRGAPIFFVCGDEPGRIMAGLIVAADP